MALSASISIKSTPSWGVIEKASLDDLRLASSNTGDFGIEKWNDVVANWTNKITFEKITGAGTKQVKVLIIPRGDEKALTIFYSVDRGTKERTIKAKRFPYMYFNWGGYGSYTGKTTPAPSWGNKSSVSGAIPWKMSEVRHSIDARNFGAVITPQIEKKFRMEMENARRRIARRSATKSST